MNVCQTFLIDYSGQFCKEEQIVSFGMVIIYNAIKTGNSTTSFISIFHDVTFQFQDYHLEMDESPVTKDHNDWI